jgi:hypothetical protein
VREKVLQDASVVACVAIDTASSDWVLYLFFAILSALRVSEQPLTKQEQGIQRTSSASSSVSP